MKNYNFVSIIKSYELGSGFDPFSTQKPINLNLTFLILLYD